MNVINAEIRKTIITMISNGNAAHVGSALSEVEILNAVYKSVDKREGNNVLIWFLLK